MRKILIISPTFSQNNVIGAVRLRGLAKYLPQFGWEPTILTIKPKYGFESQYNTIQLEYEDIKTHWKNKIRMNSSKANLNQLSPENHVKNHFENKKGSKSKRKESPLNFLSKYIDEIFFYPDYAKYWYQPAVEEGTKILEKDDFDAIFSSSPPVTSHLVANELKYRFKIPWIADLRDLWTQNPYYRYSFLRKFFEQRLELKTFKNVDVLTTVSKELSEELKSLHKSKTVFTINNGFDPEIINPGTPLSSKFSIIYTGQLYNKKRDPEDFFKVIKELIDEDFLNTDCLAINFFGPYEQWLSDQVKSLNLEDVVNINGIVNRDESIFHQRQSQILLLLMWNNVKEQGVCTGKLFEYLAAERPIISYGVSKGCVASILKETESGVAVDNKKELKRVIKTYYNSFQKHGQIKFNSSDKILKYSHIGMAKKFSEIFNNSI